MEKVFFEDWTEEDWCTFDDLIRKEVGDAEMNLEKANQLKKAYEYPTCWSPPWRWSIVLIEDFHLETIL